VSELAEVECDGAIAVPMVRQAVGWLTELLPLGAGSRILDVGAGPGCATTLLAEAFPRSEVVAVDPDFPPGHPAKLRKPRNELSPT
jgi:trans-aconitate methyltransferase